MVLSTEQGGCLDWAERCRQRGAGSTLHVCAHQSPSLLQRFAYPCPPLPPFSSQVGRAAESSRALHLLQGTSGSEASSGVALQEDGGEAMSSDSSSDGQSGLALALSPRFRAGRFWSLQAIVPLWSPRVKSLAPSTCSHATGTASLAGIKRSSRKFAFSHVLHTALLQLLLALHNVLRHA